MCRNESEEEGPTKKNVKKSKKTNKNAKNHKTASCTHVKAHKERSFDGLPQEQDIRNLNKNGCLLEASCSVCKKTAVNKTKSSEEESLKETLFNGKCALFSGECCRTKQDACCKFFMCQKCHVEKINVDSRKHDDGNQPERRFTRSK